MQEFQETQVRFLDREDLLEEEMAILSSILAWEIPWTEESGGLWSMGLQKQIRHVLVTKIDKRWRNGAQAWTRGTTLC